MAGPPEACKHGQSLPDCAAKAWLIPDAALKSIRLVPQLPSSAALTQTMWLCAHVYACACTDVHGVHVCVNACGYKRKTSATISLALSSFAVETRFLIGLDLTTLGYLGYTASPRDPLASVLPTLRLLV